MSKCEQPQEHANQTANWTTIDIIIVCTINVIAINNLNDFEFHIQLRLLWKYVPFSPCKPKYFEEKKFKALAYSIKKF